MPQPGTKTIPGGGCTGGTPPIIIGFITGCCCGWCAPRPLVGCCPEDCTCWNIENICCIHAIIEAGSFPAGGGGIMGCVGCGCGCGCPDACTWRNISNIWFIHAIIEAGSLLAGGAGITGCCDCGCCGCADACICWKI